MTPQADDRARQHDRALDDGLVGARARSRRRERRLVHRRAPGIQADDRMDARHHLGDVAHVGTSQRHRRLELLGHRGPAQPDHLGAEDVRQPLVGRQFVIRRLGLVDLVVAARGDRTGQEAVAHPFLEMAQRRGVGGAHRVLQDGFAGDHVGGPAAVDDDAVRHLAGHELLAQQPDRHLRHRDRVGGIQAEKRRDGSV
jgi:hypothetical protein